jgi:hypothetical protein
MFGSSPATRVDSVRHMCTAAKIESPPGSCPVLEVREWLAPTYHAPRRHCPSDSDNRCQAFIKTGSRSDIWLMSRYASICLAFLLGACNNSADSPSRTVKPEPSERATVQVDGMAAPPVAAETINPQTQSGASSKTSSADAARLLHSSRNKHDVNSFVSAIRAGEKKPWPDLPTPLPGSILPAKRIIAYYGNPLSKRMGVLGEYEVDEMLSRLDKEIARWKAADPSTPIQPALHLVSVVAQGAPGRDGKYRLRMDSSLIEKVYGWAKRKNAILFVDIQVGQSTVQAELPPLLRFLERPDVHLALDPEFSMHYERKGLKPGKKIGIMMADEINYAIRTLSDLVSKKKLPPKILVVHRFTRKMVPNAREIRADPKVQVVMDMDGWGPPWLKFDSYRDYIIAEPVQYTGFKIFYHNDTKKGDALLLPKEVLALKPAPLYIQYQ